MDSIYYFEAYCDAGGEWRWRLKAPNHETVADGAEGYKTRRNVTDAIHRVVKSFRLDDVISIHWIYPDADS